MSESAMSNNAQDPFDFCDKIWLVAPCSVSTSGLEDQPRSPATKEAIWTCKMLSLSIQEHTFKFRNEVNHLVNKCVKSLSDELLVHLDSLVESLSD